MGIFKKEIGVEMFREMSRSWIISPL